MTHPRFQVNINGDSRESIRLAMFEMNEAALQLRDKFKAVRSGPLHGRNYQTLGVEAAQARTLDYAELAKFDRYVQEILDWSAAGFIGAEER